MPTYEYQCKACGHELEVFQKMTDEPMKVCPKCHADSLAKLVSASNFQLKGTGWYATDFRDKGKPAVSKTENKTETKSDENAKTVDKGKSDENKTKTGES